ncbi:MAG: PfkB family carbohydrate kinase, partial [Steroidobacteraceae bacterium]
LSARGGKFRATRYARVIGGMAANAALAAARLGAAAELWTFTGRDRAGDEILAGLSAEGVDVRAAVRTDHASFVSSVLIDDAGERAVFARIDDRAFRTDADLPLDTLGHFDAVHADCRWVPATLKTLAAARAKGLPTVLDAEPTPAEALYAMAAHATHTFFSEPGLAAMAAGNDHETALRTVSAHCGDVVGVTLGARGVIWLEHGAIHRCPAPQVAVVDTLGAGDVFHGAIAVALAEGMRAPQAVRFASASAALKCTRFGGGSAAPARAEVEALLARWT